MKSYFHPRAVKQKRKVCGTAELGCLMNSRFYDLKTVSCLYFEEAASGKKKKCLDLNIKSTH